jgi:hypothetical protein
VRTVEQRAASGRPLSSEQLEQLVPVPDVLDVARLGAGRLPSHRHHSQPQTARLGKTRLRPTHLAPAQSLNFESSNPQWLPWTEFKKLPEQQQAIVRSMIDSDPSLVRDLRLSRQEVFNQGRKQLTKLAWELLPSLVGPENALSDPISPDKGLFRFDCAEIDTDTLEFHARDARNYLPSGEKYICFVNPYAPTHLVACTADYKVVAVCPRYDRASRNDQHSVERLMGEQQSFEAQARVRLNLRHSDAAAAKREMFDNNARVLGQNDPRGTAQPANPRLKNFPGDVSDFLTEEVPTTSPESSADELGTDALL